MMYRDLHSNLKNMATITLTKENFWKKVSFLYGKIISTGKVRITLDEIKDKKELVWTQYEEDSLEKGMRDFKKGNTVDWKEMFKRLLENNV